MRSNNLLQEVAGNRSPLISVDQLDGLLGEQTVKVFDVRGTWSTPARALPEEYNAGHIPGASFLDWTQHFLEQGVSPGLAAFADKAGAKQAFAALGVNEGDTVVLYDAYSHMLAGRIWWAMRLWGCTNVRVLNGGWGYWTARNMPVSHTVPKIVPGTFEPQRQTGLLTSLDELLEAQDQYCVIDARGAKNFAGKAEDPRTGHIPNALNVPFGAVLDPETGLFHDPDRLSQVFDNLAPRWREKPIVTSCGSGYAATVALLALSELEQSASLFDGSFSLWKQDPDRPVEQSLSRVKTTRKADHTAPSSL